MYHIHLTYPAYICCCTCFFFVFSFVNDLNNLLLKMYLQAQAAANPIIYEEYIEKRKKEKEEEERSTRITVSFLYHKIMQFF